MLPMLPIYISYFAGNTADDSTEKRHTVTRSLAFVLGFTVVFTSLGLFAGVIGGFLRQYQTAVNVITGLIVILFGLSYLEVIRLPFFKGMSGARSITSVFSAFMFGMIYSVSLTPCVGAFLGSALMMASSGGQALTGGILLLTYSLGLGVPFVISAILIERLTTVFNAIKKHYRVINLVCGIFLILVGIAMCFGMMNALLAVFS
jgi:cytochrome c-type biogenesis protein